HAHVVPLRQLSRRGGAVAAAVRTARGPAATGAGAGPLLPLRAWLPGLRGAGAGQRRNRGPVGQGGGRAGAGTAGGRGLSALGRRLAGLREQAGAATRAEPAAPRGPATAAKAPAPAAVGGTSSDVLARRLAGLRRQAGAASTAPVAAVAPAPASPASKPASTADQVAQLRKLLGLRPRALAPVRSVDRSLDGDELAPGLRYLEQWVPFERLPRQLELAALNLAAFEHERIDTHRILAFDTETTGLAGGTGTRAFMIGASDWRDGGLRIRQLLMTTMGAEQAMLREFAAWLEPETVLLSYNGKCYDRPLLSTRYTLARLPDPVLG